MTNQAIGEKFEAGNAPKWVRAMILWPAIAMISLSVELDGPRLSWKPLFPMFVGLALLILREYA